MRTLVIALASVASLLPQSPDRHAMRRVVDEHGIVRMEAEYRNGVRDGVYRTWYPDGRPYEVRHYVDGREEGRQQSWTPDGVLYLNYEMKDGRRYGLVNATPCLPVGNEAP